MANEEDKNLANEPELEATSEPELAPTPESEFVDEDEVANPAAALKKLREKLKVCQVERQEYLNMSQRLKADHVNYKREQEINSQEVVKYAKADLLLQLLDLADSFDLAMANKEAWGAVSANWRQGVEYIYAKLQDIFRQNGLEAIVAIDVPFDPATHESVGVIEGVDKGDNMVVELVQKGYQLNGRVIRPAKVKISHE